VGQIFNVGSEEGVTINDLARRIQIKTGTRSPVVHISYEEAYGKGFEDIRYRVPDTEKIRALIGFKPSLNLDEILDRIIDFHRVQARRSS
jgi:UDP-glucose 4-epimerase